METEDVEYLENNLRLLGFVDKDEDVYGKPHIFKHANHRAFQLIVHFLLHAWDPKVAHAAFRDCWPIFEQKKQPAEFRKNVSKLYKEIQVNNQDSLDPVNPALFMHPTGHKIIIFLVKLSEFVLNVKYLKDERPLRIPEVDGDNAAFTKVIRGVERANLKEVFEFGEKSARDVRISSDYANKSSQEMRSLVQNLEEERQKWTDINLEEIERRAYEVRKRNSELKAECSLESFLDSLRVIKSLMHDDDDDGGQKVDLTAAAEKVGMKEQSMEKILNRLMRNLSLKDLNDSLMRLNEECPLDEIEGKTHSMKVSLQGVSSKSKTLSAELVDLRRKSETLLEECKSKLNLEAKSLIRPYVKYNIGSKFGKVEDEEDEQHLAERSLMQGERSLLAAATKREPSTADFEDPFVPPADVYSALYSRPKQQNHTFQYPTAITTNVGSTTRNTSSSSCSHFASTSVMSTDSVMVSNQPQMEESKLSVFSPILSSSRMEVSLVRKNELDTSDFQNTSSIADLKARLANLRQQAEVKPGPASVLPVTPPTALADRMKTPLTCRSKFSSVDSPLNMRDVEDDVVNELLQASSTTDDEDDEDISFARPELLMKSAKKKAPLLLDGIPEDDELENMAPLDLGPVSQEAKSEAYKPIRLSENFLNSLIEEDEKTSAKHKKGRPRYSAVNSPLRLNAETEDLANVLLQNSSYGSEKSAEDESTEALGASSLSAMNYKPIRLSENFLRPDEENHAERKKTPRRSDEVASKLDNLMLTLGPEEGDSDLSLSVIDTNI